LWILYIKNKVLHAIFDFFYFLFITSLQANIKVDETYDYYIIDVQQLELLKDALDEKSPLFEDTHEYGNTAWDITWHHTTARDEGLCKINEVFIKVHLTYILPKNINDNPENRLQKVWNIWYQNLENHQLHHKKITMDMAKTIEKELLQLNGSLQCEQLKEPAQRVVYKRIIQLRNFHLGYDFKTHFGKKNGTHLDTYLNVFLKE
jgi:predicted secreted Zn-dependent protease